MKKTQKGFTIVELLIVIVVIGILAALVLNAFSGVQAKARDTKRQTDVRAISSQLEAYFNGTGNGAYPLGSTLTTDSTAAAAFPGFDVNALHPPTTSSNGVTLLATGDLTGGTYSGSSVTAWPTVTLTTRVTNAQYGYLAMNVSGGAMAVCTVATACNHYMLVYNPENVAGYAYKDSLN